MQKYVAGEEVRVDGYGEKRFWVAEDLNNGLMIVQDLSGTRITVSEKRIRPAVSEENSGKTTLLPNAIQFVGTELTILEEPIALELEEKEEKNHENY